MAYRQIWTSPNKMWRIVEVKKLPHNSNMYRYYGHTVRAVIQKGPEPNYRTVYLGARRDVIGGEKRYGVPKYVRDKARFLMLAKLRSAAKKR